MSPINFYLMNLVRVYSIREDGALPYQRQFNKVSIQKIKNLLETHGYINIASEIIALCNVFINNN